MTEIKVKIEENVMTENTSEYGIGDVLRNKSTDRVFLLVSSDFRKVHLICLDQESFGDSIRQVIEVEDAHDITKDEMKKLLHDFDERWEVVKKAEVTVKIWR